MRSALLPTMLWGKSPCEVAESVIRRLQNTSSWTGSEAECRDAVCFAPNDVVGKVPVRSCRECHQKTAEHHFVNRQWSRVLRCGLRWISSQLHSHQSRSHQAFRISRIFGFFQLGNVQNFPASPNPSWALIKWLLTESSRTSGVVAHSSSSELSAHQMAPSGVIAHPCGDAKTKSCVSESTENRGSPTGPVH